MRILVTNDDGIHAPGIKLLQQIAEGFAEEVWVVAPTDEQSGAGHSLSLSQPLRLRKWEERRFSVNGTPTDAVMMALGYLMKDTPPDLILSGINRGANLGEDMTYSGTVSAAIEGSLAGVPAIAFSQVYARQGLGESVPFAAAEAWAARVLRPLIAEPMARGTLINVNFPPLSPEDVRGIRVCRQGFRDHGRLNIERRTDPRGFPYFWFGLDTTVTTPGHITDLETVADGYVSVTPLHLDLTHEPSLAGLADRFAALD